MIDVFNSYPSYKDSGVRWLGDVPAHWAVLRQRNAVDMRVSNVDKHIKDGELAVRLCNYVDVYKNDRIADRISFMCASATQEEIDRFRLQTGDVLITKDSETWNDIGVPALVECSARDLICGYHLALLRPRDGVMDGPFLLRVQQSLPVAYQYHVSASGVTRYGLSHEAIKSVCLPCPPLPEQAAIVRFLDHADRRIQRYIQAKQKLIKLLEEQKQAIIHRAVTRGLDPNVRLKPSGVEWLGDVPQHWMVARLGQLITPIEQGWSPQCDAQRAEENEWGVLKVGCVNRDAFDETQNKKLPSALEPIPGLEIRDGDILMSRANTRELLGLAAVAVRPREKLILCDKLFRFRAKHQVVNPRFLVSAIRQRTSRAQIESSTNGASDSMQNIGQGVARNLLLSLPPLEEQQRVVAAVSEQTASINTAISRARSEISLLREFRSRLVADVVTGKLDVREAAAGLPDEADEPEPLDDAASLDTGEAGDDADSDAVPEESEP